MVWLLLVGLWQYFEHFCLLSDTPHRFCRSSTSLIRKCPFWIACNNLGHILWWLLWTLNFGSTGQDSAWEDHHNTFMCHLTYDFLDNEEVCIFTKFVCHRRHSLKCLYHVSSKASLNQIFYPCFHNAMYLGCNHLYYYSLEWTVSKHLAWVFWNSQLRGTKDFNFRYLTHLKLRMKFFLQLWILSKFHSHLYILYWIFVKVTNDLSVSKPYSWRLN